MSTLEQAYKDWIIWKMEEMIQDDYGLDEEHRNKIADYTEEDLRDLTDELINDNWLNEQINNTIELAINRRFGGE